VAWSLVARLVRRSAVASIILFTMAVDRGGLVSNLRLGMAVDWSWSRLVNNLRLGMAVDRSWSGLVHNLRLSMAVDWS